MTIQDGSRVVGGCIRAYDRLLAMMPAAFRQDCGAAMSAAAADVFRDAFARRKCIGVIAVAPRLLADLLIGLWREHRAERAAEKRRAGDRRRTAGSLRAWLESISIDMRHGRRAALASPTFFFIAAGVLAVAFGAQALVLAVVDQVLVRPLPYEAASRLVAVYDVNRGTGENRAGPSPGNVVDWHRQTSSFDALAAWMTTALTLRTADGPEAIRSAQVTRDFFRVFAQRPVAGRVFVAEDFDAAGWNVANVFIGRTRVVVLSHGFWVRRFGGDPGIVGRTVNAEGELWRVIGVMPRDFSGGNVEVDVWTPWEIESSYKGARFPDGAPRNFRFLRVVGRLRDGTSREQAERELQAVAGRLAAMHPRENAGWSVRLAPLHADITAASRPALFVLGAAVTLIVLLACGNVAALLLTRNDARSRDFAIMAAIGASRTRLLRQFFVECLFLTISGAVGGLVLGGMMLEAVVALVPIDIPRIDGVTLGARVTAATMILALLAAIAFVLVAALQIAGNVGAPRLREGGASLVAPVHQRLRAALVVSQVAIALTVLIAAGLTIRSFARLRAADMGFDASNVLVIRIALDASRYNGLRSADYYRELTTRLGAISGVVAAGAVTALPLSDVGTDFDRPYWRDGETPRAGELDEANVLMATPDYFRTLRIPLLQGRAFVSDDRLDRQMVVIVNQTLAKRLQRSGNAVGTRVVLDYQRGAYPYEIVGVVGDTRPKGPRSAVRPEIFIAHAQNPYLMLNAVIRTNGDPGALAGAVRQAALGIDPGQPLQTMTTMEDLRASNLAVDRFTTLLLSALGSIALMVAALGLYGLLSLVVHQRTREIGLRMALGADRSSVLRLVVTRGLALTAVGWTAGMLCAASCTWLLQAMLFGVSAIDPATFAEVAFLLVVVSLAATYLPARRAMRVDPIVALRA